MKSVKMFGKKISSLFVFLATVFLIGTAAIAVPANADTQTVTGETVISYIVTANVAFGAVAPSTTETELDVITAGSGGNTITVTAVVPSGGTTNALEELRYVEGTVSGASGVPLIIWNEDTIVSSWLGITLSAGEQLSMEADTGTAAGTWPTITITFTVG